MIKNFRVFLLLIGRKGKNGFDDVQAAFFGLRGGKGVAVSRLALSGKGAHQVFFCLTVSEICRHGMTSFSLLEVWPKKKDLYFFNG